MHFRTTLLSIALTTAFAASGETITHDKQLGDSSIVHDLDAVTVVASSKDFVRLRHQPISSTLIGASQLTSFGINDLRQLSAYVPSFAMPEYGSKLTSSMYIRGIGSRLNNPAVCIYVDDMPILNKNAFNTHLYETERVDVLRGPQGTLYGMNSEGGIVRVYSKNPMRYQGTDIQLELATRFWRKAEVAHYAKFNDQLAMSIAAFYDGQNGFHRNSYDHSRADNYNEAGGKVRLIWQPSQRFSLNYIADYQYVRQNGFPYGLLDINTGRAQEPATNLHSNYRRNIFNTGLGIKYAGNWFDVNSMTTYQYLHDYMLMDQDYTTTDYMNLVQRQHQNALTEELTFKTRLNGVWNSVTGAYMSYQWLKTTAPVGFGEGITSPISTGIRNTMYNAMVNSMASQMIAQGMPEAAAKAQATSIIENRGGVTMNVTMQSPGVYRTPQFNFGLFHESNITITDRLMATLGLRYDFNRVKLDYDAHAIMSMTANVMGTEATYDLTSFIKNKVYDDFNQLLPKIGLTLFIDDAKSNVYATVSKGYRAGGYNIQMFSDILQTELMANSRNAMRGSYDVPHDEQAYENITNTIVYKPETSWNYEVGTHLNMAGGSIHMDAALYYMLVRNQQLSVMADNYGFGRMMVNAGKSYSCGAELALRGEALDNHLSWMASYGYTHAVFKDYKDNVTIDGVEQLYDYKDKKVPYVPAHTLAVSADYRFDFNGSALRSLTIGANTTCQGKIYWDEMNTYSQKFYALLGAHADMDFGILNVSLWGKNITNTRYNTFAVGSAATGEKLYFANQGNPIQGGITLRAHF
ncbi:MAG: TonB-dependent receptor [Prevotella sp.]|nr:TonB-dependent receptor [Prevotella sp.]